MRSEHQGVGNLDAVGQFNAHIKRWRRFEPFVRRRSSASDLIEPVEEDRPAALLQQLSVMLYAVVRGQLQPHLAVQAIDILVAADTVIP